ncbi:hypothetical protein C7H19_07255 [Aphanothece hegewaldii CCALA 016]|uniref:Probable membrane transporter protein n=1 Tax=Aphanothece hegewaldii CCALA 016 TaxID=2107694 RepID=A0A2T1M0Q5_9CHRO|nr:sulfite exporter TauE/SafE family protein [Aphanothece hegewaldii]PSF38258.1 hypothetical protein C7H19_07255 [Aphanothece hegewaldii CCALA 016]
MNNHFWLLVVSGLFSGLLAGLLGIGGGTVLVPILITMGYSYAQSVATSSLAIVMTSLSGSFQNWRMGYLKWNKVILLGLPGILTAFLGAYLVGQIPKYILEAAMACLLLITIYLSNLRQKLEKQGEETTRKTANPILSRLFTGGAAGLLSGLFGVGGGVIMVPLQMMFLGEKIKLAIQTSLGVIMITSISSCLGHAKAGNVLFSEGIILGIGGLIGAQISTRFLPKLPDQVVKICFYSLLLILSIYFFIRAWHGYLLR